MRQLLCVCMILALAVVASSGVAKAHELKEDNGVVAVLHIEPDDNPVAQRPTKLEVEFASTTSGFSIKNYDVTLRVVENHKTIHTYTLQPAKSGANGLGEATVIFPNGSTYDVVISGEPKLAGVPKFSIEFPVQVTGPVSTSGSSGAGLQTILISATSLVLLVIIATSTIRGGGKYSGKRR